MIKRSTTGTMLMMGLMLLGMWACKGPGQVTKAIEKPILSESEKREYNYALTEATKQKIFGNFKQAASLYRKCIEVNPGSDVAHFQLAGISMITGDYEDARDLTEKALALDPGNYWYNVQMAQLYLMNEQQEEARGVYEAMTRRWPQNIEIQYELAKIYAETGAPEKALELLNRIEQHNGISEPVSILKEQIYLNEEMPEEAVAELQALIEVNPEEIRYLGILAELYASMDEKEKAMEIYRRIFTIEPENGIAQLSMAEFYRLEGNQDQKYEFLEKAFRNESLSIERKMSVMIDLLTNQQLFSEQPQEIGQLLDILEKQYPEDFRVRTAQADYLSKIGEYEASLAIYNQLLELQENNYFLWEQAIFVENSLGKTQQVYERAKQALKMFPDKPLLYLFLGSAAMELNRNAEAVTSLEKGLDHLKGNVPLTVQFYAMLAEAQRNLKNHDASDQYFEKALEMEPDNIVILNNYAYYLSLREVRLDDAERFSRKTIQAEPDNATYLDTYAWVLFKSGKISGAGKVIEKAIENGGDQDPDILEHYGDILKALGRKEEAAKFWQKAIEAGGNEETLKRKIGQ